MLQVGATGTKIDIYRNHFLPRFSNLIKRNHPISIHLRQIRFAIDISLFSGLKTEAGSYPCLRPYVTEMNTDGSTVFKLPSVNYHRALKARGKKDLCKAYVTS
jgi:hypothetical protein